MAPVVSGAVNPGAFYRLVQLATELADLGYLGRRPAGSYPPPDNSASGELAEDGQPARSVPVSGDGGGPVEPTSPAVPGPDVLRRWEALEQAIVAQAVELMSGPGGLISYVRRGMFAGRLGGPSIPLDVGYSQAIPAGIRHAVRLRDRHCQWPGGYFL